MMNNVVLACCFGAVLTGVNGWQHPLASSVSRRVNVALSTSSSHHQQLCRLPVCQHRRTSTLCSSALYMVVGGKTDKQDKKATDSTKNLPKQLSAEETTEKYGLEAGLFQSMKQKSGGGTATAQSLLKKYGVAYLATSIPLAVVSFALCYVLVDAGVDVSSLLSKVGIDAGSAGEKAGTAAIAYAFHKAASPLRFPPTVILTPFVAKLIGKNVDDDISEDGTNEAGEE